MDIDKETLEKMLNVITKVYDKSSKPKENNRHNSKEFLHR